MVDDVERFGEVTENCQCKFRILFIITLYIRICYELTTIFQTGVRGQNFEQHKTFATDYDSTTNPNIYQFVAIRGLCGMGA